MLTLAGSAGAAHADMQQHETAAAAHRDHACTRLDRYLTPRHRSPSASEAWRRVPRSIPRPPEVMALLITDRRQQR
jgi:hypothetical protein